MKKVLSVILSIAIIFVFCACGNQNVQNLKFSQEVTIVKMPSPPKCKTTNDISVVEEIITVLGEIEKSPIDSEERYGGWSIMIKLNIDGQELSYTIGSVFTDADGRQYYANNYEETVDRLTKIYNKLDVTEVDYP